MLLVLLLWVVAIALFINRWGKIRMLEPYLPAYKMTPRAEALTGQVRRAGSDRREGLPLTIRHLLVQHFSNQHLLVLVSHRTLSAYS